MKLYVSSHSGIYIFLSSAACQTPQKTEDDEALKAQREANPERTASGRVQRASAQVANFHLAEIANNDLPKDWPKRKFQSDLVPDDKKAGELTLFLQTYGDFAVHKCELQVIFKCKQTHKGAPIFSQRINQKYLISCSFFA